MTLLQFDGIHKHFGGVAALGGVSGTLAEGEILGLVGPNGSGKSTLINVLSGFAEPNEGRITFAGTDVTNIEAHHRFEAGIARTYQIPRPFSSMTARQNVAVPLIFGKTKLHPTAATDRAMHWLDFARLASYADQPVSELNLHQLKYLELARALASEPRVLFLDEVLAGLNPTEIEESILMIRRIHDLGISLVIVEHVLRVVNALSTRIVALNQGLVIAEGAPSDVMKDPEVVRAYLGSRWKHA